jgi:hypothetical protein
MAQVEAASLPVGSAWSPPNFGDVWHSARQATNPIQAIRYQASAVAGFVFGRTVSSQTSGRLSGEQLHAAMANIAPQRAATATTRTMVTRRQRQFHLGHPEKFAISRSAAATRPPTPSC